MDRHGSAWSDTLRGGLARSEVACTVHGGLARSEVVRQQSVVTRLKSLERPDAGRTGLNRGA